MDISFAPGFELEMAVWGANLPSKFFFVHKELVGLWHFQPTKLFYFNKGLKTGPAKSQFKQIIILLIPGKLYPLLSLHWWGLMAENCPYSYPRCHIYPQIIQNQGSFPCTEQVLDMSTGEYKACGHTCQSFTNCRSSKTSPVHIKVHLQLI